MQPIMDRDQLEHFLAEVFPQLNGGGDTFTIVGIGPGEAVMRLAAEDRHLRPGGTVSGPSLFALADVAAYVAILAHIGPVAMAVTTNMTISFLRRASPGALLGEAKLLKLGKRLATVEIGIRGEADADLAAHAVATYSIPTRESEAGAVLK